MLWRVNGKGRVGDFRVGPVAQIEILLSKILAIETFAIFALTIDGYQSIHGLLPHSIVKPVLY